MNNKVYAVSYKDYNDRNHLHFCTSKEDVNFLKRNYDVTEVDYMDASFIPHKPVYPDRRAMA